MLGKSELIGIDIGQYSIKIARVKQSTKSITATQLFYEVIPSEIREKRDDAALAKMVVAALKKQKIARGQAVLHVNLGECIMRKVTLDNPNLSGINLEAALETELSSAIPFGIDQVYFDYDEKADVDGSRTVIAVRRDIANKKTVLLESLPKTFVPPQVDVDAFALSRLLDYVIKREGSTGNTMIVDIGYNRSRFHVYRGSDLIFTREQQIGGKQVNDIIVDVFDINEESAENRKLARDFNHDEYNDLVLGSYLNTFNEQMNLVFDFYEASEYGRESISKVYLTGGGALLHGLADGLNSLSKREVRTLDLSSYIRLSGSAAREGALLQSGINHALAMGLAIEG